MHLRRPVFALSAGVLLALAACSGSPGQSPTSTTSTSPSPTHSTPPPQDAFRQAPAAPIPGAREGGTLTVLSSYICCTFDPTGSYFVATNAILSGLVVRSLTQLVYDPLLKAMVLVPDLATDLGRPNEDFTTWKFTLRPGVKFENGRPVTPADIRYGIERSFDRHRFPAPTYSTDYFLHGHTYKGPYETPGPYDGVTINGRVITIRMARPFLDMSYFAAFPAMSPIPPGDASDPATYQNHPWATGPYMFKPDGYVPSKSLVLVKNPYWDPDTDPGRHQYVDELDFNFAVDSSKIDQTLLTDQGAGQTTLSFDDVLPDDYPEFKTTAPDRLILGATNCTNMWNPDNRKITDVRVRRALAYAYPYRAAWSAFGSIPGVTRLPASNVMTPGTAGRVEYNPLPGHEPGTTDPAKAKAMLTAAGKLGFPIRFLYTTDGSAVSEAVKDVLVTALTAAGFDPEPVATTTFERFWDVDGNPNAPINVRHAYWCADWPSGGDWVPPMFQSTDIAKVGLGSNLEAFSSKSVDDKMAAIPRLLPIRQEFAWNALEKSIQTNDFPVLVTNYGGVAMMRGSKVHGAVDDSSSGMPTWKDIWIG